MPTVHNGVILGIASHLRDRFTVVRNGVVAMTFLGQGDTVCAFIFCHCEVKLKQSQLCGLFRRSPRLRLAMTCLLIHCHAYGS